MQPPPLDPDLVGRLLHGQRWAALATLDHRGEPAASMVAYVPDDAPPALLFHLSRLAAHTRHLLERPQIALVISAPDNGDGDPQLLPRLSLSGPVATIPSDAPNYDRLKGRYLERLPTAAQLFELGDFQILRFTPTQGRFVGGFGRAYSLDDGEIAGIIRSTLNHPA